MSSSSVQFLCWDGWVELDGGRAAYDPLVHIESPGLATDLALLELEGSTITDHGDHLVIRTEDNPTYRWGNFLLLERAPAPDEIPTWIERFAEEFPDAAHRTFGIAEVAAEHSAWERHGYTVAVDVALAAERLEPPRHEVAAEVRPLTSDEDWEQSAVLAAGDHEGGATEENLTFERLRAGTERQLAEEGRGRWFGAWVDGRLVSRAGVVVLAELARFRFVVTHPDARRQGLAAAVVHAAGQWALDQRGVERLVIVADAEGPAINLYRSLGFHDAGQHIEVEKQPF